jgi:hypothetical protein
MMYNLLDWLTSKDVIFGLLQLGLLGATVGLIVVGFFQALAARAQVEAAKAQVTAANAQAAIAKSQLYANLRSADMAMRPILRIEVTGGQHECDLFLKTGRWKVHCDVMNIGLGPALEIEAYYGNDPSNAAGWFLEALGTGEHRIVDFLGEGDILTIRYKSTHGSIFATQIQRYSPPNDEETFQFHKRIKDVYAGKDTLP